MLLARTVIAAAPLSEPAPLSKIDTVSKIRTLRLLS
jgi:hypothetical protein